MIAAFQFVVAINSTSLHYDSFGGLQLFCQRPLKLPQLTRYENFSAQKETCERIVDRQQGHLVSTRNTRLNEFTELSGASAS